MTLMPSSIALHMGAHKTATTHLQRSLADADLPGVSVIGPPMLRERGQTLPERFGFPLDERHAEKDPVNVSAVLRDLAGGSERLVLSDENFAGKLQTGWGRLPLPIYPTASKRLALFCEAVQAGDGPPPDLFLCIRNPTDFLTSAYSQVLHGGRRVRPAAFVAKNNPDQIDWVGYIEALKSVGEIRSFTVWRYEDYPQVFRQVTQLLTGHSGVISHEGRIQKGLSQEALDLLMRTKDAGVPLSAAEAAKVHPRHDNEPALTLYDAAVRARSVAAYADQWAVIRQMNGVTALNPSNA